MHQQRATTRAVIGLVLTALLASVLTALITGLSVPAANATHGRSLQLTWHTHDGSAVEFHSTVSFRRSYFGAPNVGDPIGEPCLYFGDGDQTCGATVIQVDAANDVLTAEVQVEHTYAGPGPFQAELSGCCRLSAPQHINNPDGEFVARTTVDLAATTANPVSTISPIVDCRPSTVCSFTIPASDPDGGAMRYRLATATEAGNGSFEQPGPPYAASAAAIDATTGRYTWDTTGATLNADGGDTYYSTQVVIENLNNAGATVTTSPVDFFIRITTSANQAPVFTAPTPVDGTVINAGLGSPVSFSIAASDPDAADLVGLSVLNKPSGATFTTSQANPASGTFTWTPSAAGQQLLTLVAADNHGLQALQRSVTIKVSAQKQATILTVNPQYYTMDLATLFAPVSFTLSPASATLRTASGAPVAGKTIQFTTATPSVPLCQAVTDAQGLATCQPDLLGIIYLVLGFGVDGRFAGDSQYEPSTGHTPLLWAGAIKLV